MQVFSEELFKKVPIIGILRGIQEKHLLPILSTYQNNGFNCIEVTMNTIGAEQMIQRALQFANGQLNVGAGTVRTTEELDSALQAGAQFIVTPILNPDVIRQCKALKIPIFPGAYTPTEVYQAWEYGATAVKIFPATTGGLKHIKAIQGPLDHIPLIPTGGVGAENIGAFFDAGVFGVGMGSQLFPKKLIQAEDWDGLGQSLQNIYQAYLNWKNDRDA